ncbi:MAG: ATP-binding protein [Myxococcaceae bacterium]
MSDVAPIRILLVEDDEVDRQAVKQALARFPAHVQEAQSLEEARRILSGPGTKEGGNGPDVVLLDYFLPASEAPASISVLRAVSPKIPLIILSGLGDEERAVEVMRLGANDYVSKPALLIPGRLWNSVTLALELSRVKAKLEEKETHDAQLRERLLGIVSHDLRNPLAAIIQAISLLHELGGMGPKHERYLQLIGNSSQRMAFMIEQLLDFTNLKLKGVWAVSPAAQNLTKLAQSVVEEQSLAWPGRVVQLQSRGAVVALFDQNRMWQVASNLIANALAHGDQTNVAVETFLEADDAVLEVRNGGDPIPPEELEAIFDPFKRGEHVANQRGLGLGLYIARELVALHNGRLTVQSDAAQGTTFRVYLPQARRPSAEARRN